MSILNLKTKTASPAPKNTPKQIGTRLAHALALAGEGWAVFPIWHVLEDLSCACGGKPKCKPGKHPRCDHGHLDATTDQTKLRQWWSTSVERAKRWQCSPDSNIG